MQKSRMTKRPDYFFGYDYGRETTLCILDQSKSIIHEGIIKNVHELKEVLKKYPNNCHLLETKHHWIPSYLEENGYWVFDCTGYESYHYSHSRGRNKTDRIDAQKLANMLWERWPELESIDYEDEEIRDILHWAHDTTQQIGDIQRKIKAHLKTYYMPILELFKKIGPGAQKILKTLADPNDFSWEKVKAIWPKMIKNKVKEFEDAKKTWQRLPREREKYYIQRIQFFMRKLELLEEESENIDSLMEQKFQEYLDKNPSEKWINTIPRIGSSTALMILYCLPRVNNEKSLAAFLGVAPLIEKSGKKKPKITFRKMRGNIFQSKFTYWCNAMKPYIPWCFWKNERLKTGKKQRGQDNEETKGGYSRARKIGVKWCRIFWELYQTKTAYVEPCLIPIPKKEKEAKKTPKKAKSENPISELKPSNYVKKEIGIKKIIILKKRVA